MTPTDLEERFQRAVADAPPSTGAWGPLARTRSRRARRARRGGAVVVLAGVACGVMLVPHADHRSTSPTPSATPSVVLPPKGPGPHISADTHPVTSWKQIEGSWNLTSVKGGPVPTYAVTNIEFDPVDGRPRSVDVGYGLAGNGVTERWHLEARGRYTEGGMTSTTLLEICEPGPCPSSQVYDSGAWVGLDGHDLVLVGPNDTEEAVYAPAHG